MFLGRSMISSLVTLILLLCYFGGSFSNAFVLPQDVAVTTRNVKLPSSSFSKLIEKHPNPYQYHQRYSGNGRNQMTSSTSLHVIASSSSNVMTTISSLSTSLSSFSTAVMENNFIADTVVPVITSITNLFSSMTDGLGNNRYFQLFLEKLIDVGTPTLVVTIAVITFFYFIRGGKSDDIDDIMRGGSGSIDDPLTQLYDDLYGSGGKSSDDDNSFGLFKSFSSSSSQQQRNKKKAAYNIGIPDKQYIKINRLNDKYESYDFSITAGTKSKALAASEFRSKSFDRAIRRALTGRRLGGGGRDGLPADDDNIDFSTTSKAKLIQLEQNFLRQGVALSKSLRTLELKLASEAIDDVMPTLSDDTTGSSSSNSRRSKKNAAVANTNNDDDNGTDEKHDDIDNNKNEKTFSITNKLKKFSSSASSSPASSAAAMMFAEKRKKRYYEEIGKLEGQLKELEIEFIRDVVKIVGDTSPAMAQGIRMTLLGDIAVRGTGSLLANVKDRPISTIIERMYPSSTTSDDGNNNDNEETTNGDDESTSTLTTRGSPKSVFVFNFPGDTSASQLDFLRQEVTAVIRNSNPGDEALLILQSGGGTVTGYGLAAGQLVRLKEKGLKLTIAVEQVAASGGYMMASVADRIVASPFAILGSIGVITDIPNVYERLKKEGIEFQTITAGKYKRTLTPTKKITKEDIMKQREELEDILTQFASFVKENRPSLNIDDVATGEVWFGHAAVERGLCDAIQTVDDVILDYIDTGYDVYTVEYSDPSEDALAGALSGFGLQQNGNSGRRRSRRSASSSVNAFFDQSASSSSSSSPFGRLLQGIIRSVVGIVAKETIEVITKELEDYNILNDSQRRSSSSSTSIENQYMAIDERADQTRISYREEDENENYNEYFF